MKTESSPFRGLDHVQSYLMWVVRKYTMIQSDLFLGGIIYTYILLFQYHISSNIILVLTSSFLTLLIGNNIKGTPNLKKNKIGNRVLS